MNQPLNQLTLEQEFNHKVFADRVRELSREEAQELLIKFHAYMLRKDNLVKIILSQDWLSPVTAEQQ